MDLGSSLANKDVACENELTVAAEETAEKVEEAASAVGEKAEEAAE